MSVVDVKVDNNAIQKLAEKLNSEDLSVRFRTMKKLRQLIQSSAVVTDDILSETNLLRLWKGLHYCMLVTEDDQLQEDLSDYFAELGSCLESAEKSLQFACAFVKVEMIEWPLLDNRKVPRFVKLSTKVLKNAMKAQNVEFFNAMEKLFLAIEESTDSGFITVVETIISDELKNLSEATIIHCKKFLECLETKCKISVAKNLTNSCNSVETTQVCNGVVNSAVSSSKKRKFGSVDDDTDDNQIEHLKKFKLENETVGKSSIKDDLNEEFEINIWIPNKNYHGPMKHIAAKHFSMEGKHCRTISPKRLHTKVLLATPKSDPTNTKKKQVSFALNQNKSQNYEDSLNLTPRFDPDLKPVKGVLKLSPGFPEIQEKSNLFKKKKKLKRLKATRFL